MTVLKGSSSVNAVQSMLSTCEPLERTILLLSSVLWEHACVGTEVPQQILH